MKQTFLESFCKRIEKAEYVMDWAFFPQKDIPEIVKRLLNDQNTRMEITFHRIFNQETIYRVTIIRQDINKTDF